MLQVTLQALAFLELAVERFAGSGEVPRAGLHAVLQVRLAGGGRAAEFPLRAHGVRELQHFHGIERLLQDDEVVRDAQAAHDLAPRVVAVGRADDHLQVRLEGPQRLDGL